MGNVKNITHDKFPKQGGQLGKSVEVCFHYDTNNRVPGVIVRDDMEEPWETIIQLQETSEGPPRFVRAVECQYR